ncbi:MAG: hypothetical protein ACPGFB_11140 [Verrucomicrobiales bacterium]
MSPDALLNCRRLPGRLTAEQAAVLIGCQTHDIPILVKSKLIRPLGKPAPNATKYFSSAELEAKLVDEKWSSRVTDTLYRFWRDQKSRRSDNSHG